MEFSLAGHKHTSPPLLIGLKPKPAILLLPAIVGQPPKCRGLAIDAKICPVYCCAPETNSFEYDVSKPKNDIIFGQKQQLQPIDRTQSSSRAMSTCFSGRGKAFGEIYFIYRYFFFQISTDLIRRSPLQIPSTVLIPA